MCDLVTPPVPPDPHPNLTIHQFTLCIIFPFLCNVVHYSWSSVITQVWSFIQSEAEYM